MPISLKTQAERTAKTPIQARRARVGGLCDFQDTVERVSAGSPKTGRCAAVRERWQKTSEQDEMAAGKAACSKCGNTPKRAKSRDFGRRGEKAGQSRGVVRAPRRSHLPAVRAVSGIYGGVPKAAKNSPRVLQNEKSPSFQGKRRGSDEKYEVNTKMVKGKEKFALWITPECKQLVDDCYADDQCQSRSEYIEKAILFYTGFLYAEKADRYLPKVLQQILAGTLDRFAERIGRQLFKLAVEQNVNNHILASDTDIDARSYQKMRGLSMEEVKRTNGKIDFEDVLLSERGV